LPTTIALLRNRLPNERQRYWKVKPLRHREQELRLIDALPVCISYGANQRYRFVNQTCEEDWFSCTQMKF